MKCECGFYDRDRPHSRVGGGVCEYSRIRRSANAPTVETQKLSIEEVLRDMRLIASEPMCYGEHILTAAEVLDWVSAIKAAMRDSDREYFDLMDRRDEAVMQAAHLRIALREGRAEIERLTALLAEARDVIRDEVEENYPWKDKYPSHMRRYAMDMDIVNRIDAALAGKEKEDV